MSTAAKLSLEELRTLGDGVPAPPDAVALYRRAFAEFKTLALWNRREHASPTIR